MTVMFLDDLLDPADDWSAALCAQVDPDLFFPGKGEPSREAKRLCRGCEIRERCLQKALDADEPFGVWGGLSERERRRLKRDRLAQAA